MTSSGVDGQPLALSATGGDALGFRPLYRQVRDRLMRRIADGQWQPGQILPSETQIAAEFGVSQGTVRKALDEMAAEHILTRRQGRGTFVSEHNEQRVLFQYFKLAPDDGGREFPDSVAIACEERAASEEESAILKIEAGAPVIRIRRVRSLRGQPCVSEYIVLPAQLFPGLAGAEIPNNLYALYAAKFGVTVSRATEKLKAIPAAIEDAAALQVPVGTPVLRIDRLALTLDGLPAEWRVYICRTDSFHYLSDLR